MACAARQGTAAEHCFHGDGMMLTSDPPQMMMTCCYCGQTKTMQIRQARSAGEHGPFDPMNKWRLDALPHD